VFGAQLHIQKNSIIVNERKSFIEQVNGATKRTLLLLVDAKSRKEVLHSCGMRDKRAKA
jgi:hypothetical protein